MPSCRARARVKRGAGRDGESSTSFPRPRGLAAGVSRKRQKESRAFRDIVVASTSFFEKQRLRESPVRMARDHALGAWGKASPAVLGSAENCDPQTSTSAPARGSEKPERPPQPTCSHCYRRFKTAEQLTAHVAKASHSRHDPRCGACGKHFANLDTLRQHLAGQLPNKACAARFRASGCPLCLAIGAPGDGQVHACPFEINLARLPARARHAARRWRWTARWWASSRTVGARCACASASWTSAARRC